jgi:hypothetical protein
MFCCLGALAGLPAFYVHLWLLAKLSIPITCIAGTSSLLAFDGVYLSIPVVVLLLCAVVVYRLLQRRHLFSPTLDYLVIGLAIVFDLVAFFVFAQVWTLPPSSA